jgi:hypothetical protein
MHMWLHAVLGQISAKFSAKSPMVLAIRYSLSNWRALTRFQWLSRIRDRHRYSFSFSFCWLSQGLERRYIPE